MVYMDVKHHVYLNYHTISYMETHDKPQCIGANQWGINGTPVKIIE